MTDSFGRAITYLRVSVTELCNLRCQYCMPAEGVRKRSHADMLTEEELLRAVRIAAQLGVTKVRVTGGEPLVKRNILSICRGIADIPGVQELCLTTNGVLLPPLADELRAAGVRRVNPEPRYAGCGKICPHHAHRMSGRCAARDWTRPFLPGLTA